MKRQHEKLKSICIKALWKIPISLSQLIIVLSPHLQNILNQTMIHLKGLFYLFFSITIVSYCSKINSKTPEQMIQESISQYPGKCPCPYSIMSNGKKCGKRSAYSRPGGYQPLCYVSDVKEKKKTVVQKKQIRIVDGDTIHINKIKYRLQGIDAPEINQQCKINNKSYSCGHQSKIFLKSLMQGKEIICKQKDIDRYKRIVAVCFADGLNLNQEMVRSGWAIAYRLYSEDYVDDEIFAENNRLGIWKGSFIRPQNWRKRKKSQQ
tara:strand:- start:836 stop:1627 length:792 start_codon:yes stop_codon:yes gene_type:complete